nr:hypothetical protein [uncultured Methanobacterium sp.]
MWKEKRYLLNYKPDNPKKTMQIVCVVKSPEIIIINAELWDCHRNVPLKELQLKSYEQRECIRQILSKKYNPECVVKFIDE